MIPEKQTRPARGALGYVSGYFQAKFTTLRRRLCRLIDPSGFFNSDASREIDRLTVEVEALRECLAAANTKVRSLEAA